MSLRLVQQEPPSSKESAAQRIKRLHRIDGVLQCNRCGSHTSLTLYNGSTVLNGRIKHGTVIIRHVCADCWKQGITQFMLPDTPREVKKPKPRRTKPKLVK